MNRLFHFGHIFLGLTFATACATAAASSAQATLAHAVLQSPSGVGGTIMFSESGGKVTVTAQLTGVAAGEHGFHIHETGDCSAPDFKSAGGHFNPTNVAHGAPSDAAHHAGDLGNITIAADGSGKLTISSSMFTLAAGTNSIVGKAVIVHEKADDFKTQPTGNAGGRIACGVIELGDYNISSSAPTAPPGTSF